MKRVRLGGRGGGGEAEFDVGEGQTSFPSGEGLAQVPEHRDKLKSDIKYIQT